MMTPGAGTCTSVRLLRFLFLGITSATITITDASGGRSNFAAIVQHDSSTDGFTGTNGVFDNIRTSSAQPQPQPQEKQLQQQQQQRSNFATLMFQSHTPNDRTQQRRNPATTSTTGTALHRSLVSSIETALLTTETMTATTLSAPQSTPAKKAPSTTTNQVTAIQRDCSPNADGVVFSDDDFNTHIFSNVAEPQCTCSSQDNTDIVLLSLVGDNSTNVTQYLTKLNHAVANIVGVAEYNCVNQCEHCFRTRGTGSTTQNHDDDDDAFCGIIQTNETSTYRGTEGNFTVDEYSSGTIAAASWDRIFSDSAFAITTCITYTQNEVGTLCFGSSFENLSTALPTCYVQYNATKCNSCNFQYNPITDVNITNNDCFIVDCSNIVPNAALINTCNGTGYDGIFRFLQVMENGITNATTTTVTVGSCDGPPTPPPVTLPANAIEAVASSPSYPIPIVVSKSSTGTGTGTCSTRMNNSVASLLAVIGLWMAL
jgi:hypothetical protein